MDPSAPVRTSLFSKRSILRPPSAPPPPYSGPPSPNPSADPSLPFNLSSRATTPTPSRTLNCPEVPSRRLPPIPRPISGSALELIADHGHSESPSRGADTPSLRPSLSLVTSLSSSRPTSPLSPGPEAISPSQHHSASTSAQITKHRSVFHLFSALKLSKATRNARSQIEKQGALAASEGANREDELARPRVEEEEATREREEEMRLHAEAQAGARETVKSCIQSLLSHDHPSEESHLSVFSTCSKACKVVGLNLSAVLQEPIIEGQTPIYWAILNRPATSSKANIQTSDALVIALLNVCGSLNETTIVSVRLACMLISNNALLQHLFGKFPGLSPLSTKDRMLLGPSGGGDIVDVQETQDGTGTFTASMKIRRFRVRMNVSMVVKVEFVTFERCWAATFSASTEHAAGGSSENKRLFSLELAKNSIPAYVNADLCISGHSHQDNTSGNSEPIFSVPVSCGGRSLQPGPGNAVKVRLDNGPMGQHWVNDSQVFVDSDGTLHAQLNVKLTQSKPMPPAPPDTPRPTTSKSKASRKAKDPNKPVYTSLRRGGR